MSKATSDDAQQVSSIEATLDAISEGLRNDLEQRTSARDDAIKRSRELIRRCAESIRAIHRRDWAQADEKLEIVRQDARALSEGVADFPDLYHSGYTQDALKEVVEAFATYAIIRDEALPTPQALGVESATYLKGLSEAATELRRFILDIMRRQDKHSDEAERLLMWMDAIYDQLVTFDFPDAITHGLRRQTDIVRGVLERTRGDLTQSLRQQALQDQLAQLEVHLSQSES
jgi:translin